MPRRIVLLSDGTGNSSANFWRTNVWRMFCALDLTSNDQVACYDDGVGTSSFKPLALLGGAFGIGLRRTAGLQPHLLDHQAQVVMCDPSRPVQVSFSTCPITTTRAPLRANGAM